MTLSLAACGSKAESSADSSADQNTAAPTETDTKAYKVAIIKQLDHASLDEIANAITARLDEIAAEVKQIATSHPMFSSEWVSPCIREQFEDMYCHPSFQ